MYLGRNDEYTVEEEYCFIENEDVALHDIFRTIARGVCRSVNHKTKCDDIYITSSTEEQETYLNPHSFKDEM